MGKFSRPGQLFTADFFLNCCFAARERRIFANLMDCVVFH